MVLVETLAISECDLASGASCFFHILHLAAVFPLFHSLCASNCLTMNFSHCHCTLGVDFVLCPSSPAVHYLDSVAMPPTLRTFAHLKFLSSRRHSWYCLRVAGSSVGCFHTCACFSEFNFSFSRRLSRTPCVWSFCSLHWDHWSHSALLIVLALFFRQPDCKSWL